MSDVQQDLPAVTKRAKPAVAATQFIFVGDPNDNGRGSRAPRFDDDDDTDTACKIYGIRFPLGKAVSIPLEARIGTSSMLIVDKLRGNNHFFEGSEAEFQAAKASGQIKVKPAPKKTPQLVRYAGMRRRDLPDAVQSASMDD